MTAISDLHRLINESIRDTGSKPEELLVSPEMYSALMYEMSLHGHYVNPYSDLKVRGVKITVVGDFPARTPDDQEQYYELNIRKP